jgi:hypothetical protein
MRLIDLAFQGISLCASLLVLGCSSGSDTGTPSSDAAAGDAAASSTACPALAPAHSSRCSDLGLRCQWIGMFETTSAFCDGRFWRVVSRDRDCPSEPGTGACGEFRGSCSYLVQSGYPTAGPDPAPDTCLASCSCSSGQWTCSDSCTCPGKSTQEPEIGAGFDGGCLHQGMRCEYRFHVGDRADLSSSVATQPCDLIYTCRDSSWGLDDRCSCPVFELGKDYVASLACYGTTSLQCIFPPLAAGALGQNCGCVDHLWSCK